MAKKSLEKMLAEAVKETELDESTRRTAIFSEYWDEIQEARKQGHSWRFIYNTLHRNGVVDYTYPTFLYYKNKRMRREEESAQYEARKEKDAGVKGAPVNRPSTVMPGSNKVEMPNFGSNVKQRDKRF